MQDSYREQFAQQRAALNYDEKVYAPGTGNDVVWQVEQMQLSDIVMELRQSVGKIDYLDFACGTGRVIAFMEDKVDTATGIEISPAMIDLAQHKVNKVSLLCKDITAPGVEIEGKYDLITAFRFILNAEPSLRMLAFEKLALRLKNESSLLVFNMHGNPYSYKSLFWPYHAIRRLFSGKEWAGNYMTNRQVKAVLREAGLEVVQVIGMGFISPKLIKLLPYKLCTGIERLLAGKPLIQVFGVNQLFITRRKS